VYFNFGAISAKLTPTTQLPSACNPPMVQSEAHSNEDEDRHIYTIESDNHYWHTSGGGSPTWDLMRYSIVETCDFASGYANHYGLDGLDFDPESPFDELVELGLLYSPTPPSDGQIMTRSRRPTQLYNGEIIKNLRIAYYTNGTQEMYIEHDTEDTTGVQDEITIFDPTYPCMKECFHAAITPELFVGYGEHKGGQSTYVEETLVDFVVKFTCSIRKANTEKVGQEFCDFFISSPGDPNCDVWEEGVIPDGGARTTDCCGGGTWCSTIGDFCTDDETHRTYKLTLVDGYPFVFGNHTITVSGGSGSEEHVTWWQFLVDCCADAAGDGSDCRPGVHWSPLERKTWEILTFSGATTTTQLMTYDNDPHDGDGDNVFIAFYYQGGGTTGTYNKRIYSESSYTRDSWVATSMVVFGMAYSTNGTLRKNILATMTVGTTQYQEYSRTWGGCSGGCITPAWVLDSTDVTVGTVGKRIVKPTCKVTSDYIVYSYILQTWAGDLGDTNLYGLDNTDYTTDGRVVGIINRSTGIRYEHTVNDALIADHDFDENLAAAIGVSVVPT
jgi:hypothetical protein